MSTNINKTTRLADDAKAAAAGYNKYVLVGVGAIVGVTALLFLFGLVTGNESAFLAAMILLVFVIGLVVLAPEYVDKERESGPKRE